MLNPLRVNISFIVEINNRELKQVTFLSTRTPVRAVMEWVEYGGFVANLNIKQSQT